MEKHLLSLDNLIDKIVIPFSLKVLLAIVIWIIGSMLVNAFAKAVRHMLNIRLQEPTLVNYATSAIQVALRICLVMGILEVCGMPTTSFAAMLGAVGVALGVAWSGLLSNFAAGIFLVVLRPFKVGDYISAAGQTGSITEIGLITTTMLTDNNLRVTIGNNKLFSDVIINYSALPTRRVDLRCQIAYEVDPSAAIERLMANVTKIANVLTTPAPSVQIQEFNAMGTLLAVRLYAPTPCYGQVYDDTNRVIAATCAEARWPAPAAYQVIHHGSNQISTVTTPPLSELKQSGQ